MPIFRDYFASAPYPANDGLAARALLARSLDDDFFLACLASYLLVLDRFFRIGLHVIAQGAGQAKIGWPARTREMA